MKKVLLILAALMAAFFASAQDNLRQESPQVCGMDGKKLERVDSVINEAITDGTIPGAVVSVVRGDKIAYLKAYGNKSLVPEVEPMSVETVFDLASLSKCFGTTLSFMQLIEKGLVRLTDKVNMYIPAFKPWTDPETGETVDIIIRDLLTHSSGLDAYANVESYVAEFGENTPDSFETYLATRAGRNFRPGTKCLYSCLNFITLQRILEKVTGERLCDYARKNVFEPLGLQNTCYLPSVKDNIAPTEVQKDGKPLVGLVHDPIARRIMGGNSGNAGVFSNALDLSVICAAIMNGGALPTTEPGLPGHRVLGPLTVDLMCEIPVQNDPAVGRALGWDKDGISPGTRGDIFDPDTCVWHTGYTGTSALIDMKTKTALIILTNRVHPEDKGSLARLRALAANIVAGAIIR